jgi:hypothetical protein
VGLASRFFWGTCLLGLAAGQANCTFPSDWEFASGGSSNGGTGGGTTSGPGTGGGTTSAGGMGGGATSTGPGGSSTTSTGSGMCASDTADCDMDPANGCEASLTSTQHCGACEVPCQLANVVDPCGTGTCMLGQCILPYENCDNVTVNGCEANLLTDKNNCGVCGMMCAGGVPNCANGTCTMGCSEDQFEPNETAQAPVPLPMQAAMVEFDANDNDFVLSMDETGSISPNFTTNGDVDVFYLHVTDDVPLPMGAMVKGAGFDITLSGIPAGATYSVKSHWICEDNSDGVSVFNVPAQDACPVNGANTGFLGDWWFCQRDAPAPLMSYTYGHQCTASGDATGVLQIEVKVVTPPGQQTCNTYSLTVHVFPISV